MLSIRARIFEQEATGALVRARAFTDLALVAEHLDHDAREGEDPVCCAQEPDARDVEVDTEDAVIDRRCQKRGDGVCLVSLD